MSMTAECLSGFALDRLRLGELDGRQAGAEARRHIYGCARCARRLAEQGEELPPRLDVATVVAAAGRAGARARARARRRRIFWVAACAVSIAAVVIVGGRLTSRDDSMLGIKGSGWALELVARHPSGEVQRLDDGASLRPGTPVRFEVAAADAGFIAIVSLDATGKASPLIPLAGGALPIDGGGRKRLLNGAVAFDDAPGAERISYVHCRTAFEVETALSAARRAFEAAGGRLERVPGLGLDCREQVFWLRRPGAGGGR